ncbi:MAG TPA: hypothetical protein VM840_05185, partial [Actinomycetota bacterium]|nr:hypothetical protein [Actinomycetota bacterium]
MRVRHVLTVFVSSMLVVGAAWAGIGLAPVPGADPGATLAVGNAVPVSLADAGVGTGEALGADEALVGAAKVSIKPQPDAAEGEVWQREGCAVITNPQSSADHVADFSGGPWAENPNCIYMGGYGIGPTNPVRTWDDEDDGGYGLWSRSVAVSRGGQLVVLTILDAVYYFGEYRTMCPGCGAFDLANDLAEDYAALGATPSSFVFASTHSHTAPDFIGGWGGVPRWYHEQVAEAMKRSVADALASMRPATIVAGETLARAFNSERRDNYRSAEDPTLAWFRALDRDQQTIATVGAYAAHAVSVSAGAGKAHADYPAVFARRAEDRFGGVGMVFQAGLGNMSPRSGPPIAGKPDAPNWERQGYGLADAIPATGGTLVTSPDVRVRSEFWDQPVTN